MTDTNFAQFFQTAASNYGNRNAIYWKENNKYEGLSGSLLKELIYLTSKAIEEFGLSKGDKAAIISETRYEWVLTDFACIMNGLVTIPIYTTMASEQIKYILEHSEAKLCFVSSKTLYEKANAVFNELPSLKKIITFTKIEADEPHVIYFEDLISRYNTNYNESIADEYFTKASLQYHPDDLMTIIYTSGTTGMPKGVMLSHKNILSNIEQCVNSYPVSNTDRFLSFLPLAHTYERTAGYYLPLSIGAEVYYCQSIDTLQTQMAEVKPTVQLTVPILFNRIQSRVLKNIESQSGLKRFIAKKALAIGKKYRTKKNHFLWKLADKKVFRQIRSRTGGKLRFFISGGSALKPEVQEFFDSIGIQILQGYGMTEASPVISVNRLDNNKFGTVGSPLEGIEVNLGSDGEILVKGDNLMLGYYKNEKDTSETIIDGWLHTGDIGVIDEDGIIKITDRKKTLIKTSGGKYISLTHTEETVSLSDYVEQIFCYASDERQYVSALVVPNFDELGKWAKENNIIFNSNKELIENKSVYDFMEKEINLMQKDLAKYERVRKFALMHHAFTIESGELTPTLKLKRKVIEEKYKVLIDGFYILRK